MADVAKTYTASAFEKKREEFRDDFDTRFISEHGDVNSAADICGVARQTVHVWRQRGGSLPDIFQIKQLAAARGQSPAWLAYKIGPRDASTLALGLEIASDIEKDEMLKTLMNAYKKARPSTRTILAQLARELTNLESDPAHAEPAGASLPPPIAQEDAQTLQDLIDLRLREVPAETTEWEKLDRVSRRLALLSAPRQQPVQQQNPSKGADSVAAKKSADANAATPGGKT